MKNYFVYILANKKDGILYMGFTDNIVRRVGEHKNKKYSGFTEKYNIKKLIYFEKYSTAEEAKTREKQIKRWKREWKIELIEKENPDWIDLSQNFQKYLSSMEFLEFIHKNPESI
jgi:putative endonuclease